MQTVTVRVMSLVGERLARGAVVYVSLKGGVFYAHGAREPGRVMAWLLDDCGPEDEVSCAIDRCGYYWLVGRQ